MKKLLIGLMLLSGHLYAQVSVSWTNDPGGVAAATDASNNVYTANWDYSPGGDITLTKRNAAGTTVWQSAYNNTNTTRHEVATWVETDAAGNILVSGSIRSGYTNPVNANSVLMKFDPSGKLLWRVVYGNDFDGSYTRKCIVDAQNNIYVLGLGQSGTGMVTTVRKFSESGATLWVYFDTAGGGAPLNFKLTPDNKILIVGRSTTGNINGYSKIDSDGNLLWRAVGGVNSLTIGDAAGDSAGNTYIINGAYTQSSQGCQLKKISPTGSVLWSATHTTTAMRVEVGTDDQPVICGYPSTGAFGTTFAKFNTNGVLLWQNLDADGPNVALLAHAQLKLDATNAAYLVAGTMFAMGVCKVNQDGSSAWTSTISGGGYGYCMDFGTDNSVFVTGSVTARLVQGAVSVPAAPTNLSATATGSTTISIVWQDNATNETGYIVQRSISATSGFATIATLAANTQSFNSGSLGTNTPYYFRVQAINEQSASAWSNIAIATTWSVLPLSPTGLSATTTGASAISLTWTDNATNETSYVLQRSVSATTGFVSIATLLPNITTYTNIGLSSSQKYYYRLRSENANGVSDWSNIANATTWPVLPAAPTTLVAIANGCNAISMSWSDKSVNETGFEIHRSNTTNGTYTLIATLPANSQTYLNDGLVRGKKYFYRIRAVNAAGASAWSNKANATAVCNTPPSARLNLEPTQPQALVYPNPVTGGRFNLQLPVDYTLPVKVYLYNTLGEQVAEHVVFEYNSAVEVATLPTGTYLLVLRNDTQHETTKLKVIR